MKPKSLLHQSPPPCYITATKTADTLGLSRQSFYHRGIASAMPRWKVGRVVLYAQSDVAEMRHWLRMVRPGLMALGFLNGSAPLLPTSELLDGATTGTWDCECPICHEPAVGNLFGDERTWCPKCGFQGDYEPPT